MHYELIMHCIIFFAFTYDEKKIDQISCLCGNNFAQLPTRLSRRHPKQSIDISQKARICNCTVQ